MKIAVCVCAGSRAGGGVFTATASLYSKLASLDGVEVTVFAPWDVYCEEDQNAWGQCKVIYFRKNQLLFAHQRMLLPVKPDVIHLHGLWTPVAYLSARTAIRSKTPLLVSPHGMLDPWARANSKWKKDIAWMLFQRRQLLAASCLHALNLKEAESIRATGYSGRVEILPNGVEIDYFGVKKTCFSASRNLCFLGRIHPKKGIDVLIKAWALALKSTNAPLRGWSLLIAGWDDGNHLSKYRSTVQAYGLEDVIQFVGPKFGSEKEEFLKSSEGFILPSWSEGLPVVVLEAWSFSLPVLGSVGTNLTEEISSGAGVVISMDSLALAEQLNNYVSLSVDERRMMGLRGRGIVEKKYSWESIAEKFKILYESLV